MVTTTARAACRNVTERYRQAQLRVDGCLEQEVNPEEFARLIKERDQVREEFFRVYDEYQIPLPRPINGLPSLPNTTVRPTTDLARNHKRRFSWHRRKTLS
jgi:hypothetical protein